MVPPEERTACARKVLTPLPSPTVTPRAMLTVSRAIVLRPVPVDIVKLFGMVRLRRLQLVLALSARASMLRFDPVDTLVRVTVTAPSPTVRARFAAFAVDVDTLLSA